MALTTGKPAFALLHKETMKDEMPTPSFDLAAALLNRPAPARLSLPKAAPRSGNLSVKMPEATHSVPDPRPQPIHKAVRPASVTGVLNQEILREIADQQMVEKVLAEVRRVIGEEVAQLSLSAKSSERSEAKLSEALMRAQRASPETLAMLESENKRHLQEIQNLQSTLERTRRAMHLIAGGGMKPFYRRLAEDLGEVSESAFDLIDAAPGLSTGEVPPEIAKRLAAFVRTAAEVIGEYSDNCRAYAAEDDA